MKNPTFVFGQVGPVGAPPPGLERVGLDQLPSEKNCTRSTVARASRRPPISL